MHRLSLYLVRLFTRQTLTLLGIMLGLLFLVQCLKIFDLIAVQGQDLGTLFGQALLTMPLLGIVLAYVCMGIGLVRALGNLQASQELHIIHANRQLGALIGAIAIFAGVGAVIVLFFSNFVQPWASHRLDDWSASIAADVVGRTLTPHRFSEVIPGVTIVIGGRQGTGDITDFFADDARDPGMRRTFIAKSAKVGTDQNGYVLELHDGSLQYLSKANDFSQVSFKTYNVALGKFAQAAGNEDDVMARNSWEIVADAMAGNFPLDAQRTLYDRLAQGVRVIAMCVFMGALAGFPHARRGRNWIPLELVALGAAYAATGINANIPGPPLVTNFTGPIVVLVAGLLILFWRLRPFHPQLHASPA